MNGSTSEPVTIYLTGGFLGSGKTTAIVNACRELIKKAKRVAVITNDQGDQQVDSGYLQSLSIPHAEVANGCFCCNYEALEKNIQKLGKTDFPEIIFAESVGSCTDLVATIAKPFALYHPGYRVVISVFADASLVYSIIQGQSFFIDEPVQYIYRKQLEEADIIILNKIDLLTETERDEVRKFIALSYPGKIILCQDSYQESDITDWLTTLASYRVPSLRSSLDLDYDVYGAGEAALAWLDQKMTIHTALPVAADTAMRLIQRIYTGIRQAGYTIGHLKFLLQGDTGWTQKISYTTGGEKNNFKSGEFACKHISLLVNARVQTTPQLLKGILADTVHAIMMETGSRILLEKQNAFQPGYPKPKHRI